MFWSNRLLQPVVTPDRQKLVTLSDARDYVLALPKSQHDAPHVQAGIAVLLRAAEGEVCEFTAQAAVAHIVHGPPKQPERGKPDRPWMERKSRP